jgi:small conductance mechanosensitive channel
MEDEMAEWFSPEMLAALKIKVTEFGVKIILALLILIVGRWLAGFISRGLSRMMGFGKLVDSTVSVFVTKLIYFLLMAVVIVAALGQLGVQTTSFVAVLGAAGLAVGLALQGSLSNFAAGILLVIFRPLKVDEYIEGAGSGGTVEEIGIFTTQLKTPDNKTVIIPNSKLTGDNIINYSRKENRRVDMVFGVSYSDDLDKVRRIIVDVLSAEKRILPDPETVIAVSELGESSIDFVVRPWVKTADYWAVKFALTEAIKKRFDQENISIPFPQRDVHVYNHSEKSSE